MPSYNKGLFIVDSLASVLNQTYPNWELIIIDDTSTDNSRVILEDWKLKDARIFVHYNAHNIGASGCRNQGISFSKGEYVIFLDADDILLPNCLDNRVQKTIENVDFNMWIFSMGVFTEKIGDDLRKWNPKSKSSLSDFLQHKLPWSILQVIWRKSFLLITGGFDERFERLQDVELHTKALLHPEVKISLHAELLDCYYRIDEKRLNFNPVDFLQRWVKSAVLYYSIYVSKAEVINSKKYLIGTIYHSYIQLLLNYKNGRIATAAFSELEKILLNSDVRISFKRRVLFKILKSNNTSIVKIPGLNRIVLFLLIHIFS